jgi:dienelactone hydrolase
MDEWTVLQEAPQELQQSGFYGAAYQNVDTGEIVIAYRGTEPNIQAIRDDLSADIDIGAGEEHPQFVDALAFAQQVNREFGGQNQAISVTGHSLGGGLAQLAADTFGWAGVTFEAPGMSHGGPIPQVMPEAFHG